MSYVDDYAPDYDFGAQPLEDGEYSARVTFVVEKTSKNGNPMLEVKLDVQSRTFYWHLVAGEWFDKKATQFFVCFGIPPGNFNYGTWDGAVGRVYIERRADSKYSEIKYLIAKEGQGKSAATNTGRIEAPRTMNGGYQQPSTPNAPSRYTPPPRSSADDNIKQSSKFMDDIPF